jgi:fucose 4-O-acetylase-like acetyltransferase
MGTLACGLAMTAAFLALTPRRTMWFTELGRRSMYVYLLHGFVIFGATFAGWYHWANRLGPIGGFAVVSALGVLLAVALASRPVQLAFRWVVEPRLDWAFRSGRTGRTGPPDRRQVKDRRGAVLSRIPAR